MIWDVVLYFENNPARNEGYKVQHLETQRNAPNYIGIHPQAWIGNFSQ